MNVKDVTVTSFNFSPGMKGPVVGALVQFVFEGIDEPQFVWVDLTREEIQTVVAAARMVERRFIAGESPVPESARKRLGFL